MSSLHSSVDGGGGAGEDEEDDVSKESFVSDGESHDLKVPCMGHVHYLRCASIFRFVLWSLVVIFQTLPVSWIALMAGFFSQEPSFITWMLSPGIGICGAIEISCSWVISALAIVQLLQKGRYSFIHKCRVIFNVVLAAFLSHLLVFFLLSFAVQVNFPGRIEKEMRRELNSYKRRGRDLHELWERTQEKYSCCGFGGDRDYAEFPPSCCSPHVRDDCTAQNKWKRNCFSAEATVGMYYMRFGTVLLGISIPFACLFYMGFRYFRPYWRLEEFECGTIVSIQAAEVAQEEDDDDSDNPEPGQ